MLRFTGKVVVITGARSGIGQATVLPFSRESAAVVLVGRTEKNFRKLCPS